MSKKHSACMPTEREIKNFTSDISNDDYLWNIIKSNVTNKSKPIIIGLLRQKAIKLSKTQFDHSLFELMCKGLVAVYRNDAPSSMSQIEREGAFIVGGAPRHLLYIK